MIVLNHNCVYKLIAFCFFVITSCHQTSSSAVLATPISDTNNGMIQYDTSHIDKNEKQLTGNGTFEGSLLEKNEKMTELNEGNTIFQVKQPSRLALRQQRRIQGGDMSNLDMESIEAGFLACIVIIILVMVLCCVCCCGGGGRCSLWDCVAIACLWEICCDRNDGIDNAFQICQ